MKKLVFIEANTTGTGMLAIEKARKLNLHPVFITNDPSRYKNLNQYECSVVICNTNNIEEVINTIMRRFENLEIAGVTTTSEFYIETVAIVAEKLNLVGNLPMEVRNSRNKLYFRQLLNDNKEFYNPYFFQIQSIEDLVKIKNLIKYPCIVKPVDDTGSNGVKKCSNYTEVHYHTIALLKVDRNVRHQVTAKTVLVEEFLDGLEYSIECFTFNGKHQIVGFTKKTVINEPYFVESGHIFPAPDIDQYLNDLKTAAITILSKINWRNGPTHIEVRIINQQIALIEFNGRLAGGMIPELIKYASGIDLLEEQINVAIGNPPILRKTLTKYAGIKFLVPVKAGVVSRTFNEKLPVITKIKERKLSVRVGDRVSKAVNSYGRLGHVIAVDSSVSRLQKILSDSLKEVNIKTEESV